MANGFEDGELSLAEEYTANTGETFIPSPPEEEEVKESADSFIGDAEAILSISDNADSGIFDLVDAYKSNTWDNPEKALQIVETYANKLREKNPGEQNLLTAQETLEIAPVKPVDVDDYIQSWEQQNLAKIKESSDPLVRAYNDTLAQSIEQVATGALQAVNNEDVSVFEDKIARVALGALPGLAKLTGAEKYLERSLRADSNDTLASAVLSGVGSILALPLAIVNLPLNAEEFAREQYKKSRAAGASVGTAALSGGIEGLNQAADVLLDKVLLGTKARKAAGYTATLAKKALGEGTQEFAQDKITDAASVVGLSKDELDAFLTDQSATSFAAGAIIGGGAHVVMPNAADPTQKVPSQVEEELVIPFPEIAPMPPVAVVGEPVHGGTNLTFVENASTGDIEVQSNAAPVAESDAGELFIAAPDGTITRVLQGEQKQAHSGAIFVSPENAQKIAALQASEPNGKPIVIQQDDLGRPYIKHPNVGADLEVHEDIVNPDPVMIPEDTTGHVLQYSERQNNLGSVEHSATVSQGKSGGVSTVGAQAIKESSIADKLRASNNLNANVRDLLGLNEDFAFGLTYVPNTNDETLRQVNDTFAKYDNNYVAFANEILGKDFDDISSIEALAALPAGNALSAKADSVRATDPEIAAKYDTLATKLFIAYQKVGSTAGQELQQRSAIPITGDTVILAAKSEAADIAVVKAAQESGLSVQQVDNITQENTQLDKLSDGLNEREIIITETDKAADERHDAPDKQVAEIEKDIQNVENSTSSDITSAEEALDVVEKDIAEVEKKAANLEKEADDIETAQEEANDNVKELTKKVEELTSKPIEVDDSKVETLKAKKVKPEEGPEVKAAKEKVKAAKGPSEKAQARLELTKAINEEKLRGKKERAALEAEITAAEEAHRDERQRAQEAKAREIKALKDEISREKKEASATKKAEALEKRKQANELRADNKRLRAEKQAALVEARKKRAAETSDRKKDLKAKLAAAKDERTATKQLRKEQLALDKERIKAAKEALKEDREKIQARKDRNKRITDAVDKYKKEFTDKLTPEEVKKINDLVQIIKTLNGIPKKNALDELGRTIARVKGVEILPGSNPLSAFWQANVLFSVSTNTANIVGNFTTPIRQMVSDLATANPSKAYKFIRGWANAMFSSRTFSLKEFRSSEVGMGLFGELPSRSPDDLSQDKLKNLTGGTLVTQETDTVKSLKTYFGKGLLGKFLSSVGVTFRLLGAMDAVFYRASKEGRIARDAEAYQQYLSAKAADYNQHVSQARNEEAQLKSLGVALPRAYVNMRADELSFASRPETQRNRIVRAAKKDVFQEESGPRGAIGSTVGKLLNAVSNVPVGHGRVKDLNVKKTVATALGFANKTARDNVSVDEIYPLVTQGLSQGKTLVINGTEVKAGSTKELLGSLLQAVTDKQIISLKGDSIRPFKYAIGMFVNTGSQILDLSMELIPGAGFFDKKYGGKWREYTPDEKAQLYGTQVASTVLTGALLASFLPDMDDEDNAYVYVYGGMRDEKLRKAYEAKGIRPFSFRVGNTTVSYKDIPGLNLILGGIGELADTHMVAKRTPDRPISTGASIMSVAMGSAYTATQLSLLKNIGTMADLLALKTTQGATSAWDVVSNIAAGFVPYAGAGRELERFVYGDLSRPKNTINRMLQNIPFAKFVSDNKPAINMFGEALRPHVYPGISRFIGEATNSFELDWMLRNGYSVSLPKAGNVLSKKDLKNYTEMQQSDDPDNFEPYLTEEDQRSYMEAVGPELKDILGDFANSYPQGFDERVQDNLNKRVKKMKARVKRQILSQ